MTNHRSRYIGVQLTCEENAEVEYFLRVETSHGTMRLPGAIAEDGKLVFNWIVFEEDTVVYGTQLFRIVHSTDDGFDDEHPVTDRVAVGPGDTLHLIPAHHIGCFVEPLPD